MLPLQDKIDKRYRPFHAEVEITPSLADHVKEYCRKVPI